MMGKILTYIQYKPRRSLALLGTFLVFIWFLFWLAHYLTTGAVIISTNDKGNNLQLQRINTTDGGVFGSNGSLHARVPAGQYVAVVGNRVSTSKHIVTVTARHTVRYTINVQKPTYPEPVLSFAASNIAANGSKMLYVDLQDYQLHTIGGSNTPVAIPGFTFNNIKWLNVGYGVGLGNDQNSLYTIKDGAVSPVNLPFPHSQLFYDLPPDGRFVVSDGKSIYKQAPDGTLNKIFTVDADKIVNSLKASNNNVLLKFSPSPTGDGDEAESLMIDMQGQKVATKEDLSSYAYTWSPDGKWLAVTNDTSTQLYDNHLRLLKKLPDINVLGLTWRDNNTLLYGSGGSLFSYNVQDNTSTQLATISDGAGISGIYPSDDKSQIYVLVEKHNTVTGDTAYNTVRITPGKTVPDYLQGLSIFLPVNVGVCSLNYVNFSQPTIAVQYPTLQTTASLCVKAAKSELNYYGSDASKFQYVTSTFVNKD